MSKNVATILATKGAGRDREVESEVSSQQGVHAKENKRFGSQTGIRSAEGFELVSCYR